MGAGEAGEEGGAEEKTDVFLQFFAQTSSMPHTPRSYYPDRSAEIKMMSYAEDIN